MKFARLFSVLLSMAATLAPAAQLHAVPLPDQPFSAGTGSVASGLFATPALYDAGGQIVESVKLADVNGDGKLDLIVANNCGTGDPRCSGPGSVSVSLGKGDGTFRPPMSYSSGGVTAISVAVGDVDGDGKQDLVVANYCGVPSCSLGILLGNGDGTFRAVQNIAVPEVYATAVAIADMNKDGKADIVVGGCLNAPCKLGARVSVLLGTGKGNFKLAGNYSLPAAFQRSMVIADVNHDGIPDVVVLGGDSVISVLLGKGKGGLKAPVHYGSGGFEGLSVAVSDLNGDGKLDLVVANLCPLNCSVGGGVTVLLGNGDGTFQAATDSNLGTSLNHFVAVGDVNGDGKPDLVITSACSTPSNCPGEMTSVALGNGDGTFQPAVAYAVVVGGVYASPVTMGDTNGDGKPDLIMGNASPHNCSTNCPDSTIGVLLNTSP